MTPAPIPSPDFAPVNQSETSGILEYSPVVVLNISSDTTSPISLSSFPPISVNTVAKGVILLKSLHNKIFISVPFIIFISDKSILFFPFLSFTALSFICFNIPSLY